MECPWGAQHVEAKFKCSEGGTNDGTRLDRTRACNVVNSIDALDVIVINLRDHFMYFSWPPVSPVLNVTQVRPSSGDRIGIIKPLRAQAEYGYARN
jgi:hypothetical protein